jgi:hypothetical protein
MRFLIKVQIPNDAGNKIVKEGTLASTMQSVLGELKPEAVYFSTVNGERGGYIVVNFDDASQIPAFAEPLFLGLGATVEFHPVMTPEDLAKAGPAIGSAAQRYG